MQSPLHPVVSSRRRARNFHRPRRTATIPTIPNTPISCQFMPVVLWSLMQCSQSVLRPLKRACGMEDRKRSAVREQRHVHELKRGPLPAVGLATDNGHRGEALEGKHIIGK